jgi:hypothetical protein
MEQSPFKELTDAHEAKKCASITECEDGSDYKTLTYLG